jgi:hypothetical protein
VSDIDTVVVDSLKALDPKRPIREADIEQRGRHVRLVPTADSCTAAKPNLLLDVYRNFIRDDRRVERVVLGVAQHELKGMLTGRKFDARLGLARSKMEM